MLLGSRPAPVVEQFDAIMGNELAGSIKVFNQDNPGSAGAVPISGKKDRRSIDIQPKNLDASNPVNASQLIQPRKPGIIL